MSGIMNKSLGGLFGTAQSPTTTTADFYGSMVHSHKLVVDNALEKQAEIAQAQDTNDTIKETILAW